MVKAADRAAELTRQLLAFGRRQVLAPRDLDLNGVLADMDKMLQRLLGDHVTLDTIPGAGLWTIRADQGQLEQVIANLVVNARDAMSRGGTLTLATSNVELDESFIATHPGAKCGSHVLLTVRDTGSGITPEIQPKIFEPFFTTKGPGKGTGLGLATVLGIVQQSDGYIRVHSLPGHGTTFDLFFPQVATVARHRTIEPFRPVLPAGTETVLVVEDNDVLRDLTTRTLRSGGYTVLDAAGGEEALELAGRHEGFIDLLVSDVVMPGMSGRALADGLARERPGLKVLFVSGYPDDVLGGYGLMSAELNLLLKPYTPSRLRAKVREVIDGDQKEPALH
jgi:CheY-like chemotaxis protein